MERFLVYRESYEEDIGFTNLPLLIVDAKDTSEAEGKYLSVYGDVLSPERHPCAEGVITCKAVNSDEELAAEIAVALDGVVAPMILDIAAQFRFD